MQYLNGSALSCYRRDRVGEATSFALVVCELADHRHGLPSASVEGRVDGFNIGLQESPGSLSNRLKEIAVKEHHHIITSQAQNLPKSIRNESLNLEQVCL